MTYTKIHWETQPPRHKDIRIEETGYFIARGMKRVYGRGDHYGRHHKFNVDIWTTSGGRLLMRCWSRCSEIDARSFEIFGIDVSQIPFPDKFGFCDDRLPYEIREEYDTWIEEEW